MAHTAKETEYQDSSARYELPRILYDMLEDAFNQGNASIVSWMPHGRAFKVHNRTDFENKIMPRYFTEKYDSFRYLLEQWGFCRLSRRGSKDRGAYYHVLFVRGRRHLCVNLTKMEAVKAMPEFMHGEDEPDLYQLAIDDPIAIPVRKPDPKDKKGAAGKSRASGANTNTTPGKGKSFKGSGKQQQQQRQQKTGRSSHTDGVTRKYQQAETASPVRKVFSKRPRSTIDDDSDSSVGSALSETVPKNIAAYYSNTEDDDDDDDEDSVPPRIPSTINKKSRNNNRNRGKHLENVFPRRKKRRTFDAEQLRRRSSGQSLFVPQPDELPTLSLCRYYLPAIREPSFSYPPLWALLPETVKPPFQP